MRDTLPFVHGTDLFGMIDICTGWCVVGNPRSTGGFLDVEIASNI